jgi:hypothetical protein
MVVTVTCAGIPIGTADFDPPEGLAHAALRINSAYGLASPAARVLALSLRHLECWSSLDGDFADFASSRWEGPRLALEDETGRELGVTNLIVLETDIRHPDCAPVRIVADFRPDLARVEAFLRTLGTDGGGRARPAA